MQRWSIGILKGTSPLDLSPALDGPVLTHRDVDDVPAEFVADPFLMRRDRTWHLFFEVMNTSSGKGDIGLATSADALHWQYRGIVLSERFHLSYPLVFSWQGEDFMVPETLDLDGVYVYRASRFPDVWEREARILDGTFADPTLFKSAERWWMFACPRPYAHDSLCLFSSADLMGPWRPHAENPLIASNARKARPGGRVVEHRGRLLRFAQVCQPSYGTAVRAFEIETLNPREYREREVQAEPLLGPSGRGWNAGGMHHIDAQIDPAGGVIAAVDGWAECE
ncbi:MAG: hypothetical protein AAGF23_01080 [Acidobacteriota bacterium]